MVEKESIFLKIKTSDEMHQRVIEKIEEIKQDFVDVDATVCAIEKTQDTCSIFLQVNLAPENTNAQSIETLFFLEKLFSRFFNYYISFSQEPSLVSRQYHKMRKEKEVLENA